MLRHRVLQFSAQRVAMFQKWGGTGGGVYVTSLPNILSTYAQCNITLLIPLPRPSLWYFPHFLHTVDSKQQTCVSVCVSRHSYQN